MSAPRPILIHGSGGDHRLWAGLSARVGGSVGLDLPGHPDGAPRASLAELGAVVGGAIASVPGPRALVGHSLGGAVAMEVARTRPELVDGLVLIATGARLPVPDSAMERAAADFAAERERLIAGSFADPAGPGAAAARAALDACGPATLLADYRACRSVDLAAALPSIGVPALVIVGDDDPFTPPRYAEELGRALPMARTMLIPGARHTPMGEFDATLAMLVAAFLARLELTLTGA
ncbi:alpha/beta fold hydrolase [Miltoncostaea marina]|uniref:alpha/beta fold hydrolase n=1 Tax=Miltoncostaea marina TaxID=2843215 RepID=UPI001C3CA712|nr:alpha/beta fold hydrolase [Miltoncostaea marina]